jgi:hypothetical protein
MLEASISSEKIALTVELTGTAVAPSAGSVELTVGDVLSTATFTPAAATSELPAVSVARDLIFHVPSEGNDHVYVQVEKFPASGGAVFVAGPQRVPPSVDTSTDATSESESDDVPPTV